MDYYTIFAIAVGLSFDTFAASLTYGVIKSSIQFFQAVKLALVFAVFQGGLTVSGYFLGEIISKELNAFDHWIALILLCSLGIRMITEGSKRYDNGRLKEGNFNRPAAVLTVAFGTSIDALAVGISFALLDVNIWEAGAIIGMVTFLASMTAIRIGKSAGPRLGKNAEIIGGIILIAIGVRIFLEHILA
jgi:putative Mn2+ efflux pump MntP